MTQRRLQTMVSPSALQLPHSSTRNQSPSLSYPAVFNSRFLLTLRLGRACPIGSVLAADHPQGPMFFDGTVSHVSSSSFLPSHIPFVKFTVPLDSVAIETPRLDRADIIDLPPSPSLANRPPWRIHPRPFTNYFNTLFPPTKSWSPALIMAPLYRSFSLPVSLSDRISRLKVFSGAAGKDEVSALSSCLKSAEMKESVR